MCPLKTVYRTGFVIHGVSDLDPTTLLLVNLDAGFSFLFVSSDDYGKSVTFLLDLVLAYHCWRVGGAWKPFPGLVVMEMVDLVGVCSVSSRRLFVWPVVLHIPVYPSASLFFFCRVSVQVKKV